MENSSGVVEATRLAGYKEAFRKYGLSINPSFFCNIDPHNKNMDQICYEECKKMLTQKDRPTAIICSIVFMRTILRIAEENHWTIPEDLSLVATEYSDQYQFSYMNFTRIQSIASEVTELAFKKLLRTIYNKRGSFESQLNKLTLTIGDTTAAPKHI